MDPRQIADSNNVPNPGLCTTPLTFMTGFRWVEDWGDSVAYTVRSLGTSFVTAPHNTLSGNMIMGAYVGAAQIFERRRISHLCKVSGYPRVWWGVPRVTLDFSST